MQPQDKKALIDYRIYKSKETIIDAKLALENGRLANASNRIYYSIFYIVSALAIKYDFSTSKHKQLIGWFNQNFVKKGLVSSEINDIYKDAYDNRQESDYEDFIEFNKSDVEKYYNEMLIFVDAIEKLIIEEKI